MIVMIDYGVGNLFSLQSSFASIGHEVVVSGDPKVIEKATKIIAPNTKDGVAKWLFMRYNDCV